MKHIKMIFVLFSTFFAILPLSAQHYGDEVYKTVIVNGEEVSKWLKVNSVREYDINGNLITNENLFEYENYEYDENNHLIREKWWDWDKNCFQYIYYEYDSKGNLRAYLKTSKKTQSVLDWKLWAMGIIIQAT